MVGLVFILIGVVYLAVRYISGKIHYTKWPLRQSTGSRSPPLCWCGERLFSCCIGRGNLTRTCIPITGHSISR